MAKIEYIKNVITEFYKDQLMKEILESFDQPVWVSSHKWSETLLSNMRPVLIRSLREETMTLHSMLCQKTELLKGLKPQSAMAYVWEPGSHIDWHDDYGWTAAASIYLTPRDIHGGGAFMWEDDDENMHMIYPEECSAIIQLEKTNHAVMMIHPTNKFYRMSIQVFYK
jgi:hypothetical protein